MSIQFDPKVKGQAAPVETTEAVSYQPSAVSPEDPQAVLTDMDLLFSGVQRQENFQKEHPIDPTPIPDFIKNVPGVLKTAKGIDEVIHKYEAAKKNLLKRKENFETALKHYLLPEEALDIYRRLAELEGVILKTEQNLQEAIHRKGQIEEEQRLANRPPPDRAAQSERIWEQADDVNKALDEMRENPPQEVLDLRIRAAKALAKNEV